ncbi:IMPACT family protein [Pseudoxanthomonas suwonensis]|uniref:IMPACT family member in pol 5'region n=1 Tax=Pseudoxanthomonas suwonensis TaxID=314722 RepID=A0A0E3YYR2_9GAMM|nr:YigZ family protein [Pseudoxanthomonas suwonensis]AKC85482.1 IMPACT family member in pol 5'region [Pseudoxanthomonas suwonensis]
MTDTLAAPATHLLEVRHSRFLAHAAPVDAPATAMDFVARASDPDATHNCWAWRVGQDYRSSDDGEPAGTAGRPVLAAIDGQGCDRVAVVVTRWYGGIKLGAGGLVRAYGGAAAECLRLAPRRTLVAMVELELACAFEDLGAVHAALPAHAAEKAGERFEADGAHLVLRLPAVQADALQLRLRDATRDRIRFGTATATEVH